MNTMLATGGLDDVALGIGETVIAGILFVAAGLTVLAWRKRSRAALAAPGILLLLVGAFFQPWTVLGQTHTTNWQDAYWLSRLRVLSVIWVILVIAAIVCLTRLVRRKNTSR